MEEGLNEFGLFVDKDKRISFDIPNTKGAVTILIEDSDKKNLEELVQEELQFYSNGEIDPILETKEQILEKTDINLSNEPAKKIIVYVEELDSRIDDRKIMQIFSLHDSKKYSISYRMDPASFDNHLPTIEKMIQSFKFIPN